MFTRLLQCQQRLLDTCARLRWLGPLVLRLGFGYFWLETGWGKLHNLDGAIARFVDWGLPYPMWSAPLSAGTEFIGGLLLILGLLTRFTSLVMAFNMVIAIAFVAIKNVSGLDEFVELDEFLYILIFFWLFLAGPGKASLDHLIARRLGLRDPHN
ncbi:MAG: DoxX family protein [Xanthomonadales bacterium PRO7]|nr:DoxX family protein [Xanthomonadales bacterium PRO7]HMM57848.1 DoxX family protein [Rudaea sp.]